MTNSLQLLTIRASAIAIQGHRTQQKTETDIMFPTHRAQTFHLKTVFGLAATLGISAFLSGCTTALPTGLNVSSPVNGAAKVSGMVHGGQGPVIGATVQLYTVGTGSLKSASTGLITTTLPTTDVNGNFTITGKYSCVSATDVYLVATGGSSGGGTNNNLSLVAALGSCATLLANAATTYTTINELTTVSAAYALAPFASSYSNIGSPSAMDTAFSNASLLVNPSNGIAGSGAGTGVTVPVVELNTLGNILAACVNTNGATTSPATPNACNTLMTSTGASDTFGAALFIAQHPGSTAATSLYSLSGGTASPFQPSATYTSAPNDFSVAVTFSGTGTTLATPYGIAIDSAGDAWVTNETGTTVTELSPTGTVLATPTATGLIGAEGVALDRSGNVWVANTAGNSVIKLSLTGGAVSGTASFTAGGVLAPSAIALDSAGNAFVANLNGNSVTGLTSAGAALSGSPFTGNSSITVPSGIALDKSGNVYVTSGSGSIIELTNAGMYSATLNDGTLQGPNSVATDAAGHVFATGFTTGSAVGGALSQFANGTASTVSPVTAGLSTPAGVASDGTSIWVVNSTASGSLAQFLYGSATPASPTAGFGSLNIPLGIAIDAFGSVWTTNSGSNLVSKFIGIAAPVATPVAVNVGP
jgi:sugar lactone lactonase YvrE